ncbi:hypothetical protein DFP72DRAFT_1077644 [Ephemerocybe angulata]|uniref:Uncharacterized protein n=1 Tax=Ephemerocybe angulata TaxID=980116 RepID=A0A8H6HFG1_9AGAR|nr:hypothetical protein DFP72DRAFT_1077644 [Tulosesus angulatus]
MLGADLDIESDRYKRLSVSRLTNVACCSVDIDTSTLVDFTRFELSITDEVLQVVDQWGHRSVTITGLDVARKARNRPSFLHLVAGLYNNREDQTTARAVVCCRFYRARTFALRVMAQTIEDLCVVFDPIDLWMFRCLCAYGYAYIIELQRQRSSLFEFRDKAASAVTACIVNLANNLHTSPKPVNPDVLPYHLSTDRGVLFMEHFYLDVEADIPHFTVTREAELDLIFFLRAFGSPRLGIHRALESASAITSSRRSAPSAPHTRIPATYFVDAMLGPKPSPSAFPGDDRGVDFMEDDHEMGYFTDPLIASHCERLRDLFFEDILTSAPRGRQGEPSIRLTRSEHTLTDPYIFDEANLANVFNACRWKHADADEWRIAFDLFFPDRGLRAPRFAFKYLRMRYYQLWLRLAKELNPFTFNLLRRAMWNEVFAGLYWIPSCSTDSVWTIKYHPSFTSFATALDGSPYVNVLVNGDKDPYFIVSAICR